MDVWVMRLLDGNYAVQFLSDRAKAWAKAAEYPDFGDCPFIIDAKDYGELQDNLDPQLVIMYDGGRSQ